MKTTAISNLHRLTGAVIPVAALKTAQSCGVGEFLDLIPFIDFCKKCSLGLVQLLPVNDTGTESSPYSALSAFALHPIYLRLQDLPEAKAFNKQIVALAQKHSGRERFNYTELRRDKMDLLVKIFAENVASILIDKTLAKWIDEHEWIIPYAVFMELKREHNDASWKTWYKNKKSAKQSPESIKEMWLDEAKKKNHYFFAWVQMHLDNQLKQVTAYAKKNGIIIKGDIPIMMNEDSVDTWAYPDLFIDELRAGSPVDGYNPNGQNWGFPIYNWKNLQKTNYSWWKERLKTASNYYQAYRIDHVLGFFRIWAIPYGECTAVLGHTEPYEAITTKELTQAGFSAERIRWLSKSHVPTDVVCVANNFDYLGTHGQLHQVMSRIGDEEMWLFKDEIQSESDIWSANITDGVKDVLARYWKDRTLIEIGKNKFVPVWTYSDTTAWKSLSEDEQASLKKIFAKKQKKQEKLWEAQARELLGELTSSVNMIACAEDLGANPESVPRVLKDLGVLSLRVMRWTRDWEKKGEPYIKPAKYPLCSVATNSVHDSSTMRAWWLTENAGKDFIRDFGGDDDATNIAPDTFTPETAAYLLRIMAESNSAFCIHPIQDLLHLSPHYYDAKLDNERVNIPGSVNDFNWTYRLPVTVEQLQQDTELCNAIKTICALR